MSADGVTPSVVRWSAANVATLAPVTHLLSVPPRGSQRRNVMLSPSVLGHLLLRAGNAENLDWDCMGEDFALQLVDSRGLRVEILHEPFEWTPKSIWLTHPRTDLKPARNASCSVIEGSAAASHGVTAASSRL